MYSSVIYHGKVDGPYFFEDNCMDLSLLATYKTQSTNLQTSTLVLI